MFIEQDQDELRQSFEFQMNAEIDGIRLSKAAISSLYNPLEKLPDDVTCQISFLTNDRQRHNNSVLMSVDVNFSICAEAEEDEQKIAQVVCRFDIEYVMRSGFEPTEEQLSSFHRANAVFNCWPYVREFVQNSITRMSLPPTSIPFLRLRPKAPENRVVEAAPETQAVVPESTRRKRGKKVI